MTHDDTFWALIKAGASPVGGYQRLPRYEPRWFEDRPRDVCGRRRSKATMPGFRRGVAPANKGKTYPADPYTADEVRALLDACPKTIIGLRNRTLLVVLWRTGLRISEALALEPINLDFENGTVHVLHGKGDKARISGIDRWALNELQPWLHIRALAGFELEQPLFPVIEGPTKGGPMRSAYIRTWLTQLGPKADVWKRLAPHQFRHTHAVELSREGVLLHNVSKQLGHSNISTTATYLAGMTNAEAVAAVAARPAPGGHR